MARRFPALAAVFLLTAGIVVQAQEIPPSPDRWVTDKAGFISPETNSALDLTLERFEQRTGYQFLVYIDRTTGIVPIEDWAFRAFEAWKVGRKGLDDGLVVFIMTEDRRIRIEVGYGLEPMIPDAAAGRIIDEVLVPGFREGNPDGAVREAVALLMAAVSGGPENGEEAPRSGQKRTPVGTKILIGLLVLGFLILLVTNPALALQLLWVLLSSGGGRSGGGGGFSGGGGRSGGGGASGSW